MMKTRRKWTTQTLSKEAKKYKTTGEFKREDPGAYSAYVKRGKPREVGGHFPPERGFWSAESALKEASKYLTRSDLIKYNEGCYKYLLAHDLLKYVSQECRTYWTEESAIKEAKRFKNKFSLQKQNGSCYNYLLRNDLLYKVFRAESKNTWCKESVEESAKQCSNRMEFKYRFPGAHKWAYRNGYLNKLFGQTLNNPSSDYDTIYLWKVKGYNNLYKIGVTSRRLKDHRIEYVCRKSGLKCDWVKFFYTKETISLEREFLKMGKQYTFESPFSGSTEFRILEDKELSLVLNRLITLDDEETKEDD